MEEITKIDKNTVIRYRVVEERIDLRALRKEKEILEEQLAQKEPSDKMLLEWAKGQHPYYLHPTDTQRLEEIDKILEI